MSNQNKYNTKGDKCINTSKQSRTSRKIEVVDDGGADSSCPKALRTDDPFT